MTKTHQWCWLMAREKIDGSNRCLLVHAYITYHALLFDAPFEAFGVSHIHSHDLQLVFAQYS